MPGGCALKNSWIGSSCVLLITAILLGTAQSADFENGSLVPSVKTETQLDVSAVTISVYNIADLSSELLSDAEAEATKILAEAGIGTVWLDCLHAAEAQKQQCYLADAHHLVLKILPRAMAPDVRERVDVLGTALLDNGVGFYAYVFYDRVRELSQERKLGNRLLGCVIAHEVGHLLLGSSKHSIGGLMSGHWNADELRTVSEGTMRFDAHQSRAMHSHLSSLNSAEAHRRKGIQIRVDESKFHPGLVGENRSSELR